jgi:hypothetical protein
MSIYSAEDPEGRATDIAAWREGRDDRYGRHDEAREVDTRDDEAHDAEARDVEAHADEAAAGAHSESSAANGGVEATDPDVLVLEEADVVVLDEGPRDPGIYTDAADTDPRPANGDADPDAERQAEDARTNIGAEPRLAGAGAPAVDPVSPAGDASQGADPASPVGGQEREFPRTDIAADTGPELASAGATGSGPDDQRTPTVAEPAARTAQLQERWLAIQSDFVDDPRRSVASAADLVTEAIDTLVAEIKERDASLRGTWQSSNADTEVLRNTLRDYRSFLDRLVAR